MRQIYDLTVVTYKPWNPANMWGRCSKVLVLLLKNSHVVLVQHWNSDSQNPNGHMIPKECDSSLHPAMKGLFSWVESSLPTTTTTTTPPLEVRDEARHFNRNSAAGIYYPLRYKSCQIAIYHSPIIFQSFT